MRKIIFVTTLFCLNSLLLFGQFKLTGKVSSSDDKAVEGVSIILKEINRYALSNEDGTYQFQNIPAGNFTLIATASGMKAIAHQIRISGNSSYNIHLELKEAQLLEITLHSARTINKSVVSAGKLDAAPLDVPQSSTIINKEILVITQSQKLSDAIRNVNGVYLAGARAGVQETFYARGYNLSSGNIFKNGSRINATSFPEMSSLEKVEVLKGGAAILYGNVAPGGIINLVTKKPKFAFGGEASLRVDQFGLIKPAVDIYGPLSKQIAARINTTIEHSESFRDKVHSNKFSINPSVLFKINGKNELLVQGDYLHHHFTPDFGIGSLADTMIAKVARNSFYGTDWQYNKIDQSGINATFTHKINEAWNISSTVAFQDFRRNYFAVERIQAKANGDWARPLGRIKLREQYSNAQVDVRGNFNTGKVNHQLMFGAEADKYITGTDNFDITGKIYDTINLLYPNKFKPKTNIPNATTITHTHTPVERVGAYVQDLIHVSDKIKFLAGLRYSVQNNRSISTKYLLKDSTAKNKGIVKNAWSPRVGLVYKPKQNMSLFTSYSTSFSMNAGLDVDSNPLDPSTIDQFEVGIKNELFDGRLSANLTAYKIINNNLAQTAPFLADGITPNTNTNIKELAGQTTSKGIEVDLQGTPVKGMVMMAGYSFNDMRYTKTKKLKGNYIEGQRLVNTPKHTANLSGFYTAHNGKLKGFKTGVSAMYTGSRLAGWNNTYEQAQAYDRTIAMKSFTVLDFTAGYSYKRFGILAKLSNIGNVYNYYVHENYSINPIAPRMLTCTLSYHFR